MLFNRIIAFDNFRQKIVLIVNMSVGDGLPDTILTGYNGALLALDQMQEIIEHGKQKEDRGGRLLGRVTPLFSREALRRGHL